MVVVSDKCEEPGKSTKGICKYKTWSEAPALHTVVLTDQCPRDYRHISYQWNCFFPKSL